MNNRENRRKHNGSNDINQPAMFGCIIHNPTINTVQYVQAVTYNIGAPHFVENAVRQNKKNTFNSVCIIMRFIP